MNRPYRRVIAITTAALVIVGASAVADTIPITLGVVNGTRALSVTGSDGNAPVGAPALAFNAAKTSAPFGVVVTDVLYENRGYTVDARLSNLYRLEETGINCNAAIPSSAFDIDFDPDFVPLPVNPKVVVDTVLTFVDTDTKEDLGIVDNTLTTALGLIGGSMPATVSGVVGSVQELDASSLANRLVAVNNGTGGSFDLQSAHPACVGSGDVGATAVPLQVGTKNAPTALEITALRDAAFNTATVTPATSLTAAEAIAAGLLPVGADQPGGVLYEAAKTQVKTVVDAQASLLGLVSATEIDALTVLVIQDLVASTTDLVFSFLGQSGTYPNLPVLNLDTDKDGDPTTGAYHGVMTVTLTDGA